MLFGSWVRRRFVTGCFVLGASIGASPAMAADLDMAIPRLVQAFNSQAKKLDIKVRLVKLSCEGGSVKYVCQYQAGSGVRMLASADDKNAKISEITVIFITDDKSDIANYIIDVGILMVLFAPGADKAERGAAMSSLLGGLNDGKTSEVMLDDVQFKVILTDGMGVWTVVRKL